METALPLPHLFRCALYQTSTAAAAAAAAAGAAADFLKKKQFSKTVGVVTVH